MTPHDRPPSTIATLDALVRQRIMFLRIRRSVSIKDMAAELGVSATVYQNMESGLVRLSPGMVAAITRVLDCAIADLFPDDLREATALSRDERMTILKHELNQMIDASQSEDVLILVQALLCRSPV